MINGLNPNLMPVSNSMAIEIDQVLLSNWLKLIGTKQISSNRSSLRTGTNHTRLNAGNTKRLDHSERKVHLLKSFQFFMYLKSTSFSLRYKELKLHEIFRFPRKLYGYKRFDSFNIFSKFT